MVPGISWYSNQHSFSSLFCFGSFLAERLGFKNKAKMLLSMGCAYASFPKAHFHGQLTLVTLTQYKLISRSTDIWQKVLAHPGDPPISALTRMYMMKTDGLCAQTVGSLLGSSIRR